MGFDSEKHLIEKFFNGKFEVKKFLGEGSFAKVYLVKHNYLDDLMAMKIVKEPMNINTDMKSVFQEVTLASHLRHENIISIYDAALINDFTDHGNHPYFVMEYISGGDLEIFSNSFADNDMFMPTARVLDIVSQILKGLNTLHSANPPIVHRDLKLNNVLLAFDVRGNIIIKLADFGFAKEVTTTVHDIDIAGTRPYMAPELFKKSVSLQSDIYAVGVMFYRLLTNRYPYDVDEYSIDEIIELMPWKKDLNPPSHYNSDVFEGIDEIVMKCLSADPSNRYGDAGEMLEDVLDVADEFKSSRIHINNGNFDLDDEYSSYVLNDSLKKAFELAKCENKLCEAIEILEKEILEDYEIRRCYSQTLRMWKSQRPDLKLISMAFTVNLKAKNYELSCDLLREAIAYNPSLHDDYASYIELWQMFADLERNATLFKSVSILEKLMISSPQIHERYEDLIPTLKSYSVEEIAAHAMRLVESNKLVEGADLMEFAVVCDSAVRSRYEYPMSLWKQNMKQHFKRVGEIQKDAVDYAIDLGTTDSLIAFFNDGNPKIIKNHLTGEDFTPSAVLIDEHQNVEVGKGARDAILHDSGDAVSRFKNNMGFLEPFNFKSSSRVMYPEELSAEVLKDLRVSVYCENGINLEHAVICVPANSNPLKIKSVIDACELAGFRSYYLILEPIAVSLAYGLKKDNGIWMIYDMGGGTFNVTLVRDRSGEIEKLATDGLDNFGGDAFDWQIVNDLFRPKISKDLNLKDFRRDNPRYVEKFARLKKAAEISKKELTDLTATDISLDNLFDGYDFTYHLTRVRFKEIISPLIKHSFKLCHDLLKGNSLEEDNLEKLILVGGSCLSPIVREFIADEFSCEVESRLNPLTVVSKGAAIYAGSIKKPKTLKKHDDFSLSIESDGEQVWGKVFNGDGKFPFLGYSIEFKNDTRSIRVPLNIDGEFSAKLGCSAWTISIYDGQDKVTLNSKSPDFIKDGEIGIPYFNKTFAPEKYEKSEKELIAEYNSILADISYLKQYSYRFEGTDYLKLLMDNNACHAQIFIDCLKRQIADAKEELEFDALLENVKSKVRVVVQNDLFEIEGLEEIENSRNLENLRNFHSSLIERYVTLNTDEVIRDCFINLKFEGVFTDNGDIVRDLISNGNSSLKNGDYGGLLEIVNRLYEFDKRQLNKML